MLLHDRAAEIPFEASMDARFPYTDRHKASALIAEGWAISLNASFCVLEEICRAPRGAIVTPERQRELVAEWGAAFEHPLKGPLLRCAEALIDHEALPWNEAVSAMYQVSMFDGQRAALNIVYFSADCDSEEGDEALTSTDRQIREAWEKKGV
jgi:hypothetical protein